MTGFFDFLRKLLAWPCQPSSAVGGPYWVETGQAVVAGAVAEDVFVAGAITGEVV
jgi:hypothetical protein